MTETITNNEYNNEYNNQYISEYNNIISYHNDYVEFTKILPKILSEYDTKMYKIQDLVFAIQTPPDNYAYVPTYISAGPQTHYAIYKIINTDDINNTNKLNLLYDALLIVYDGCSGYLIEKNIKEVMRENNLSKREIELLFSKKYVFVTSI